MPHASSTGVDMPNTRKGLRAIRAEGGWGVVCTGYCSIHPTADDAPHRYSRLWDDEDVKNLALMVDAVHEHGALAGVELFYGSSMTSNRATREMPLSPSGLPMLRVGGRGQFPLHSRAMDKDDIRNLRTWQVDAAKRAKSAGFDIIYVYAGMSFGPFQFISRRTNRRNDEYGGSLENRVRLLREMVEDTREAVGDTCAVAVRFSVDELMGELGLQWHDEGRGVFELVGELPDLWDLKTFGMQDSSNARYSEEGYQEPYVAFAKQMTSKPVVGVGRFTSPDAMVSQIKRGVLDLIGAARPSISDPFLPKKIEEGREDDIRECIGCNICYSCYHESVPIRCTQNPTMGEEWRRGWHPEQIEGRASSDGVLVVGAGPAGLEAAREPQDALYRTLAARAQDLRAAGIRTLQKIGDCDVPGAVVHATYAGHRLAREFDANVAPMLFERTRLDTWRGYLSATIHGGGGGSVPAPRHRHPRHLCAGKAGLMSDAYAQRPSLERASSSAIRASADGDDRHLKRPARELADDVRRPDPERDPEHAAHQRQDDRLDQELPLNVPAPRAQGAPDADLQTPLGDRHQHHVHDADPSEKKGDPAHRTEQEREQPHLLVHLLDQPAWAVDPDGKILRLAAKVGAHLGRRRQVVRVRAHARDDPAAFLHVEPGKLGERLRHPDDIHPYARLAAKMGVSGRGHVGRRCLDAGQRRELQGIRQRGHRYPRPVPARSDAGRMDGADGAVRRGRRSDPHGAEVHRRPDGRRD